MFLNGEEKIRKDIDLPMIRRVVPPGTILRDVRTEIFDRITYGRQFASYPLLVGVPLKLELNSFFDILVTDHGHRSITGIPVPVDINRLPMRLIEMLPCIEKKQVTEILRERPFKDKEDILNRTSIRGKVLDFIFPA